MACTRPSQFESLRRTDDGLIPTPLSFALQRKPAPETSVIQRNLHQFTSHHRTGLHRLLHANQCFITRTAIAAQLDIHATPLANLNEALPHLTATSTASAGGPPPRLVWPSHLHTQPLAGYFIPASYAPNSPSSSSSSSPTSYFAAVALGVGKCISVVACRDDAAERCP
jgi:hypothetical protein